MDDELTIDDGDPVYWIIDDRFFACHQLQDIAPGELIAVGYVCDLDRIPTGHLFHLIERDGEVVLIWTAPPGVFERVLSMYSLALNDFYEEIDG